MRLCKLIQVFGKLEVRKPHFSRQIIPVVGDITDDDLGISDADRQHLQSNVSVVMHVAASVRYNDPLRYESQR